MPAADGGAVTTHRHQAQTTVNMRAAMATPLSSGNSVGGVARRSRLIVVNRNADAGAPGDQRPA